MREYNSFSTAQTTSLSGFMNKVYLFMTLGLLVTAAIAFYFHQHPWLSQAIMRSHYAFYGIIIAQLGSWFVFSRAVRNLNAPLCFLLFLTYSVLTGLTFGIISFVYTAENIGYAFAITAGSFFGLSLIGYVVKKDLQAVGTFCIMGLWGLIIESILALFIPALRGNTMELTMGAIGVIVFSGLTAYDTQKIKSMAVYAPNQEVAAITGAFMLYLDFINLFLSILRLFSRR